jgi:hypothetical protein
MKFNKKYNKNYILQSQLDLPFLETNKDHLTSIFKILEEKFGLERNSNQVFIDLGAGDARVILFSALNYQIKSIGIEIDGALIQEAKEKIKKLRKSLKDKKYLLKKVKLHHGDIYEQNLNDFQFIYLFSLPTMQKFLNHVFKTAKKGAIITAYKYPLENFKYLELKFKLELSDNPLLLAYYYEKI